MKVGSLNLKIFLIGHVGHSNRSDVYRLVLEHICEPSGLFWRWMETWKCPFYQLNKSVKKDSFGFTLKWVQNGILENIQILNNMVCMHFVKSFRILLCM